jgi:hypothetical protein
MQVVQIKKFIKRLNALQNQKYEASSNVYYRPKVIVYKDPSVTSLMFKLLVIKLSMIISANLILFRMKKGKIKQDGVKEFQRKI